MTTTSFSTIPQNNDDATFRAWVTAFSGALSAIGLVKTSDTGQINISTATNPNNGYVKQGYEIYRFSDALQSTYPIFIRVEYGAGSQSFYPGISLIIGKSTDGAGTIGGTIYSNLYCGFGSNNSTKSGYASSSGSGVSIYLAAGSTTVGFTIERSLNSSGAATGEGVLAVTGGQDNAGSNMWQVFKYANPTVNVIGNSPISFPNSYSGVYPSSTTTLSPDASTGLVVPIPILCSQVTPWISKQVVAIVSGDAGASNLFTAASYGASHTYRGFDNISSSPCPVSMSGAGLCSAAIWWE